MGVRMGSRRIRIVLLFVLALAAIYTVLLFVPSITYEKTDAPPNITDAVTHNFVDPEDVDGVSQFRSVSGHDYSDATQHCLSMKHYLHGEQYNVYAPFPGTVTHVMQEGEHSYDLYLQHRDRPRLWIKFFHVNVTTTFRKDLKTDIPLIFSWPNNEGIPVEGGELLGMNSGDIALMAAPWTESVPPFCTSRMFRQIPISAFTNSCRNTVTFHSVFAAATEDVRQEWRDWGVTVDQTIITRDERATFNPYTCGFLSESYTAKPYPVLKEELAALSTDMVEPTEEYRVERATPIIILVEEPASIDVQKPVTVHSRDGRGRSVFNTRIADPQRARFLNLSTLPDEPPYVLKPRDPDTTWTVFYPENASLMSRLLQDYRLPGGDLQPYVDGGEAEE